MNTVLLLALACGVFPGPVDPGASDYSGRQGITFYVSKLGDNSDGRSWSTAFNTIQGALDAIPDAEGGHRIIIRPDHYMEANIFPAHKGAPGSYNLLIGDTDGRFGSGAKGWAVLDSGDPQKGFKSYDWWGTLRSYLKGWSKEHDAETFSAIGWDRWILRQLYATGGDGGLMWDCVDKVEPFTVVVEDCVSIGRAFGGGVGNCLSRTEEPITFRRCNLWSLDWWGDAAGAYTRVENPSMPDRPDVYFEDCTMVGPQCALKGGNYGFKTFTRTSVKNCKLITLNFSQPAGTPTDGIIQSVEAGQYFHVDMEDSTLMGYKVFGIKVQKDTLKDLKYALKGNVAAYVQFTQDVPEGMYRLTHWPGDVFSTLAPPPARPNPAAPANRQLVRRDRCEVTPVIWKEKLYLMECIRPASGGTAKDYCLVLNDLETGEEVARFAEGYSLACAFVHGDTFYAFASRFEDDNWNDVTLFKSKDLKQWESKVVVKQQDGEHLFNSSVCATPEGFVLAYETNDPAWPAFTAKFAKSKDLENWDVVPGAQLGKDRYAACPCIRYADGWYYVLYLEHRIPRWFFETYIARSRDLVNWERAAANPVLTPCELDDGINASDPDVFELNGQTHIFYAVGDQLKWMNIKRGVYPLPLDKWLASWFEAGAVACK